MGGIGIGNMGSGDQGDFPGPRRGPVRGRLRRPPRGPRSRKRPRRRTLSQPRLQGLQRLPRPPGPQGHRCGPRRHARPLARAGGDRGLPAGQGRVLPEARDADAPRGPADGRGGAALRPRSIRRQPASAGRLSRRWSTSAGAANWARSSRSTSTSARSRSPATCRPSRFRPAWTGTCGSARPPGRHTTTLAATATSAPAAGAGGRMSIIPAAG